MGAHKKLVIVFDLDQTIGYFTQFAIFMEGLESYIKRKLKRDELFKLFDLYPQVFRPKMMELFKYLEKMKKKNKWFKVVKFKYALYFMAAFRCLVFSHIRTQK